MDATQILREQVIVLKRGRLNGLGFEPAFNSYFDFYISPKYITPPLIKLEDMGLHLYLRKNLNDRNPAWQMPTIRQMMEKLNVSPQCESTQARSHDEAAGASASAEKGLGLPQMG